MKDMQLKKLAICIENEEREDIVIIFADPSVKDLKGVIRDEWLLNTVDNILFIDKEKIEAVIFQEDLLEVKEDDKILKPKKILEDLDYHGEGNIEDNVIGEVILNNDEGESNLICSFKMDHLDKEDIFLDYVKNEVPSDDESGKYNDVRESDISYDDDIGGTVEETIEKFEDQLDNDNKIEPDFNKDEDITNTQKKFECDICGKKLSQRGGLKTHKSIIHGERLFACKYCDKTFATYKDLKQHKKMHKDDPNFNSCDICGHTCISESQLTRHKIIHTSEKSYYVCDVCGKSYYTNRHLRQHENTHQSDRPTFQCKICKKDVYYLRQHMMSHKRLTLKTHTCDFCGKSFVSNASLVIHVRSHTGEKPFKCDLCDYSTNESGSLKKHKIYHTGIKSFSCNFCNKDFFQKPSLERHLRVHTGEKTLSCEHCGRTFGGQSNLKRHKKTHAGLKSKTSVND